MDNKNAGQAKPGTSTQATQTTPDQITSDTTVPDVASTSSPTEIQTTSSKATSHVRLPPSSPKISVISDDLELDADILEDVLFYIGDMGLYQKLLFLAMFPFTTFAAWVYLVQIFITITPSKYWCRVSELDSLTMELRRNLTAPGAATGAVWDSCNTYDTDWNKVLESLTPPPPQTPKIPCPNGWEFELTDIPYATVASERGWVCNRASYAPTAQSIFFVGTLMGGLVFGWVADNMGRIPALIGSNLIGGIGGITTIFTSGLWDFFFCRFLVGMSFDNCFMIAYILILEYVGPGHRTWVANMPVAIFGGMASIGLPWIAYFVADWRAVLWITSVPMFVVLASPWLIPESVRWLVSRGRIDEAVLIIRKFEKINKSHVPAHVLESFIETSKKISWRKRESFLKLFQCVLMRTTMIYMIVVYSSNVMIYDALVRVIQLFGIDFFISFSINEAIEIPSVLVLTVLLDRLGRRLLTAGSLFLGSISLLITSMVPKGAPRLVAGVTARFLINISVTVLCQWGTEILPTPFRASGSSLLHMGGFALSLLSPFIILTEKYWGPLPLLIVSIWSVITGILSVLLPETKGQEMPQTMSDSGKIIRTQSLCRQPEMIEMRQAFNKVFSTTFSETIHRNPEGRISHLRLSEQGKSAMLHRSNSPI